jgi:hypothetical protein
VIIIGSKIAHLVPFLRPSFWRPDPAKQQQVDDKLRIPKLLETVERIRKESAPRACTGSNTEHDDHQPSSFAATAAAELLNEQYKLYENFMTLALPFTYATTALTLWIVSSPCLTTYSSPASRELQSNAEGQLQLRLLDRVAYSSFSSSMSLSGRHCPPTSSAFIGCSKGCSHWDTEEGGLTHNGKVFAMVFDGQRQCVLEHHRPHYLLPPRPQNLLPKLTSTFGTEECHVNEEAIRHLPTAATRVELVPSLIATKWVTCQPSKATKQVSMCPTDRATLPFAQVHLNLVQMNPAYNGNQWISTSSTIPPK